MGCAGPPFWTNFEVSILGSILAPFGAPAEGSWGPGFRRSLGRFARGSEAGWLSVIEGVLGATAESEELVFQAMCHLRICTPVFRLACRKHEKSIVAQGCRVIP